MNPHTESVVTAKCKDIGLTVGIWITKPSWDGGFTHISVEDTKYDYVSSQRFDNRNMSPIEVLQGAAPLFEIIFENRRRKATEGGGCDKL